MTATRKITLRIALGGCRDTLLATPLSGVRLDRCSTPSIRGALSYSYTKKKERSLLGPSRLPGNRKPDIEKLLLKYSQNLHLEVLVFSWFVDHIRETKGVGLVSTVFIFFSSSTKRLLEVHSEHAIFEAQPPMLSPLRLLLLRPCTTGQLAILWLLHKKGSMCLTTKSLEKNTKNIEISLRVLPLPWYK